MTDVPKVSFEFTVDEAVDLQRQFIKSSPEAASWRPREQWKFAGGFTVAMASVVGVLSARAHLPLPTVAVVIGIGAVLGLLLAIPFGWYYDHLVKQRTRRFLIEQYGGEGPHRCSIEIRPEGLWVAQRNIEMTFPWREATGVHDAAQGITVTFKGGWVLARSRGFGSEGERSEFLRRVQELMPAAPSQESQGAA